METQEIEKRLKALKDLLQNEFYVKQIGYFGSFVRNGQSPESDIDILVEFSKPLGWKFFELQELLETEVGRRVDLVSVKALKEPLKDSILSQVQYI